MKTNRPTSFVVAVRGTSILNFIIIIILLLLLIFSLSGLLTSLNPEYRIKSSSVNTATNQINGKMLFQLISSENHAFKEALPEGEVETNLANLVFKASTNINLDDPRSLLGRELPGFTVFDSKILVAGEGTKYTDLPFESPPPPEALQEENEPPIQNIDDEEDDGKDEKPAPPQSTGDRKMVYIYFTHTRESFLPYLEGVTNPDLAQHSKINVTRIGDHLQKELESRGVGTVLDKTDVITNLNNKGLKYGRAYNESRKVVEAALTSNRDLTYLIDIHRDAKRKDDTTIQINGQNYAKLWFIIGAENPNYEKNFKLANQVHQKLEEKYPGLSLGVSAKEGAGTNGKFNQDLSENALLIEFGGVDNTFDELNRSAEAFADVFSEIFWEAESVNFPVEEPASEQ